MAQEQQATAGTMTPVKPGETAHVRLSAFGLSNEPGQQPETFVVDNRRSRLDRDVEESDDGSDEDLDASADDVEESDEETSDSDDGEETVEATGDEGEEEGESEGKKFDPRTRSRRKWAEVAKRLTAKLDTEKKAHERALREVRADFNQKIEGLRNDLQSGQRRASEDSADDDKFEWEGEMDGLPSRREIEAFNKKARKATNTGRISEAQAREARQGYVDWALTEVTRLDGGAELIDFTSKELAGDQKFEAIQSMPGRLLFAARKKHEQDLAALKAQHAKALKDQEKKLMKRRSNLDDVPTRDGGGRGGRGTGSGRSSGGGLRPQSATEQALMNLQGRVGGNMRIEPGRR